MSQTMHRHSEEFILDVQAGIVPGHRIVNKFGSSHAVTDAGFTIVSHGEVYQTPIAAQALEFVSDDAGDALNGIGMLSITIEGLDASFNLQTETVDAHATDGTIAVVIPNTWVRIFRAYVEGSGSYASVTVPSHIGAITIRTAGGGATWAVISIDDIAHGQSQISAYTVPKGETAYVGMVATHSESNKSVSIFGFKRERANIVSPPYGVMRMFTEVIGLEGTSDLNRKGWSGPFPEYTDVGYLAKKSVAGGTASVSIDFEILLIKNEAA